MNIDEILMLTPDQIDFDRLSEDVLIKLVLAEDQFIATSALGELSRRKSDLVQGLASTVLRECLGDRYLRAAAFEALFTAAPTEAIEYIANVSEECDEYLFNSILETMVENVPFFKASHDTRPVQAVLNRLMALQKEAQYPRAELVEQFRQFYPD